MTWFNPTLTLYFLFTLTLLLSTGGQQQTEGCDTKAAVQCMSYSENFLSATTVDEQYLECANATKTVDCLEDMLDKCRSLEEKDEMLHRTITSQVDNFSNEALIVCSSATSLVTTWWLLLVTSTTLLMLHVFLHHDVIA